MTGHDDVHPATRAVHAGEARDVHGALHTPLYDHTTFGASRTEPDEPEERTTFYTRYGDNPTLWAVQDKVAALHRAEGALVFSSGMAAISATLMSHLQPGDHVATVGAVYGGTHELLARRLSRFGVTATSVAPEGLDDLATTMPSRTQVVLVESPSNPLLEVVDLAVAADRAHAIGSVLVVDNTFAGPINQRPLAHGADVVVESATKSLGGHSDLTGGVVVGSHDVVDRVAGWRTALGSVMAPQVAHLLARSLRTLPLRVRQQNTVATRLAAWLHAHPRVRRVHHPSLAEGGAAEVVARQMDGHGGVLSFVLDGTAAQVDRVLDRLRLVAVAPSLGGVESLATRPSVTSHRDLSPQERHRLGIEDGLVRLACGIEDPEDLIADLGAAIDA